MSSVNLWILNLDNEVGSRLRFMRELKVFKECVEGEWEGRSWRCEASKEGKEAVVEFWPLRPMEPRTGVEITWGEQYVSYFGSLCVFILLTVLCVSLTCTTSPFSQLVVNQKVLCKCSVHCLT